MASNLHANLSIAIKTIGEQKLRVLSQGLGGNAKAAMALAKTYEKLDASQRKLQRFQKQIKPGFIDRSISKTAGAVMGLGAGFEKFLTIGSKMFLTGQLIASGFRAIAGAAGMAMNPVKEFQSAMTQVRIKGHFDAATSARLSEQAKEIGRTTMFSPTQAAQSQVALAASGLSEEQIVRNMPTVLKFAQATGMAPDESSDYLVEVARQFQMDLNDPETLKQVGTAIKNAADASTISERDLRQTLKYAGPIAKAAGSSVSETVAMAAIMGNSGLKGSQAGTGLRNLFSSFAKPKGGDVTAELLDEIGITKQDLNDNIENIPNFLQLMEDRMLAKGWDKGKRIALAASLFGQYGMTAAMVLQRAAGTSADTLLNGITAMVNGVNGSLDSLDNAAALRGATIEGKMDSLNARWETFRITVGERLAPFVISALDQITAKVAEWERQAGGNEDFIASLQTVGEILQSLPIFLDLVNKSLATTVELFKNIVAGYQIYKDIMDAPTKAGAEEGLATEETASTAAVAGMTPKEQAIALQLDPTNKLNPLHPNYDPNYNPAGPYIPEFNVAAETRGMRNKPNATFPWEGDNPEGAPPEPSIVELRITTDAGTKATVTKIQAGAVQPRAMMSVAP